MGREPGGAWQPRGWNGRWIRIGDRVRLVGFGRTGTVRAADPRRGVTVQWDDGGTTHAPPHRLHPIQAKPYTPPRHVPEADPGARPDDADAYFARPGQPSDAWVRYDETGDLDGWIRYNRGDPSTTTRFREVFNDPAWRTDVEAMGLRETAPPSSTPQAPAARQRTSLAELIPASVDDVEDLADEIERTIRGEIEGREFVGRSVDGGEPKRFGVVINSVSPKYYADVDLGRIEVDATVMYNGRRAGSTTRVFNRESDGTLWVYNDYLLMIEEHQGSGFASQWNRYLEQWYRESGVERVEVTAALNAGGYVWAMSGFTWRDEYEPGSFGEQSNSSVLPRLTAEIDRMTALLRANRDGSIPESHRMLDDMLEREERELAEARAVLERFRLDFSHENYPQPREVAQIGYARYRDRKTDPWLGLRVTGGSTWKGVKWLT